MIRYCFSVAKIGPRKFRAIYWPFGGQVMVHSCIHTERPDPKAPKNEFAPKPRPVKKLVEHFGPAPHTEIGIFPTLVEAEIAVEAAREKLAVAQDVRMAA